MAAYTYSDVMNWYLGLEQVFLQVDQLAPLRDYFRFTEADKANPATMNDFHRAAFKKLFIYPRAVDLTLSAIDLYQRELLKVPSVPTGVSPDVPGQLAALKAQGHTTLPDVPQAHVADMYDYLAAQQVSADPKKRDGGALCHRDEMREKHHVGIIEESKVANCPHFLELALSQPILELVQSAMGAVPSLINLSAWWSFAGHEAPREAQNFHLDVDDHRFFKLFIYLTDVDMQSGPHTYIPGSQDVERIGEIINAKGADTPKILKWYMEDLRKTDEDVARYLGIDPIHFEGPAGSCFLVNTFGIHKGLLPETKDRLLLQATYGCTPALQTRLAPVTLGTGETDNLPADLLSPPKDYISRFYVSPA